MSLHPIDPLESYDAEFALSACGISSIPVTLDWQRLFNVSYELATREVKLYFLDSDGKTLHKVSATGTSIQRSAESADADERRLAGFLGCALDFGDVILDTIEDDVHYVYIERSSASAYVQFLEAVCRRFGIPMRRLVEIANRINRRPVSNLYECMQARSISGVKVPLGTGHCKAYARPFLTGNGFEMPAHAMAFLGRLHRCSEAELAGHLSHLWVSAEFHTDRVVITTQRHQLLHGRRR